VPPSARNSKKVAKCEAADSLSFKADSRSFSRTACAAASFPFSIRISFAFSSQVSTHASSQFGGISWLFPGGGFPLCPGVAPDCPGFCPDCPGGPPLGLLPFPGEAAAVLLLDGADEEDGDDVGEDDDNGDNDELEEGLVVDEGEVDVKLLLGDDLGAVEEGEDFGADDGEGVDEEGEEEEGAVVVGEEEEEGEELGDFGAAASASVSESSILNRGRTKLDTGPVITRKTERDNTTAIDSTILRLLIVTLLLLLSSLLLSSFLSSSGPVIY
jgi:hypothetical protein